MKGMYVLNKSDMTQPCLIKQKFDYRKIKLGRNLSEITEKAFL